MHDSCVQGHGTEYYAKCEQRPVAVPDAIYVDLLFLFFIVFIGVYVE